MKVVTITMNMEIDDDFLEELKGIIGHHTERLLSLEEYPEIHSIFDGKVEEEVE